MMVHLVKYFSPVFIIYSAYVLWPNSACERVEHAVKPAYWLGEVVRLASEPFVKSEWFERLPLDLQFAFANAVSRVFYNRPDFELLCRTDPIQIYRAHQMLDSRGLVAIRTEEVDRTPDRITALKGGEKEVTGTSSVPAVAPRSSSAGWTIWLYVAGTFLFIGLFFQSFRKFLLEKVIRDTIASPVMTLVRKVIDAHKQIAEHVLPREVIKPSAGRKKTDLTDSE